MPGTVSVACKLPHGLILQHQKAEKLNEPVMGGGTREVTRYVRTGKTVVIKGFSLPSGAAPPSAALGGYAITHGVEADFFTEWLKQNQEMDIVQQGLIFAHEKPAEVEKFAKDNRAVLSGLEPIDPNGLPAEFRRVIKTAEVA